jgi:PAS domain S-box-containing protein
MSKNSAKKILVIDDVENNRSLIESILNTSHPDYEILLAKSGLEGIEIAQSQLPEVILLDIFMPDMDGFEACKIIKSNNATDNIPVLMVSAGAYNSAIRVDSLQSGADAIISKPFNTQEFIALVNVMLRIKRAEDKLRNQNQELDIYIKKQIKKFHHVEDRFLQISGYALEFFWEIDTNGFITYISPVLEQIVGYKPEEILDTMNIFTSSAFRGNHSSLKKLRNNLEMASFFRDERLIFRHLNGKKVWMSASGFPIRNNENKLIGFRGVCQDISERIKAETDLQKSLVKIKEYQFKLKKLNSDLSITEEKERRRIAEFLHDGLSQILSLVQIKLTSLLNSEQLPKTDITIRESVKLIHNAISETRSLTYDLSPPILYELGLIPAIKWKLEQTENKFNIATSIKCSDEKLEINTDIRVMLYRIVSELITNVIKHANADLIRIEIYKDQSYLYISVIDNGQGFKCIAGTKTGEEGGFGLFSIRERLDSIQGFLIYESDNSIGTNAIVQIPI